MKISDALPEGEQQFRDRLKEMKKGLYDITPVPKPRQTQRDKWAKRPSVMRYRAFADEVRLRGVKVKDSGTHVIFYMPMPKSWSDKKKQEMVWTAHRQKPDLDNLLKALLDAIYTLGRVEDDCVVNDIRATKIWADVGMIKIQEA